MGADQSTKGDQPMPAQPKPTQAEIDKQTIDPDFDFHEIARVPFASLTPNQLGMFKWSGVYHQLQTPFFMIRLVTPGGLMTTRQFARAVDLAETYAQGELCITTRQTLQFHWVRQQDIHRIIDGMAEVGITTRNGCGDVTRNNVCCSLLGVCPNEIGDHARAFIETLANDPEIRDRQRNLPRKHKISVAGCPRACAQTLMNCQGWVAKLRGSEPGWEFHAGGGLGARPILGKRIFSWVPNDLALPVAQATVEAFRRHGDRRNRAFARLKVVVDRLGADAFGELLLGIMQERDVAGLDRIERAEDPVPTIGPMFLDGQPTIPQRQPGLNTVRIQIPRSELSTEVSRHICDWANRYGNRSVVFTNRQNVELRNVPNDRLPALLDEISTAGLHVDGHERLPDVVACVGSTVCRMGVADTTAAHRVLSEALRADPALVDAVGHIRLNITGCPNNCAHAWVSDIGLRGKRIHRPDGISVEGFDIFVGGRVHGAGRIAHWVGDTPASEVVAAIRRILDFYLESRLDETETFCAFAERVATDDFTRRILAD
jgi:sulfite reductase beta subunit-like hemoprotein